MEWKEWKNKRYFQLLSMTLFFHAPHLIHPSSWWWGLCVEFWMSFEKATCQCTCTTEFSSVPAQFGTVSIWLCNGWGRKFTLNAFRSGFASFFMSSWLPWFCCCCYWRWCCCFFCFIFYLHFLYCDFIYYICGMNMQKLFQTIKLSEFTRFVSWLSLWFVCLCLWFYVIWKVNWESS